MAEAWFRNPTFYIRELAEVGSRSANVVWDRGIIVKQRIDPKAYVDARFNPAIDYRILLIGPQGAAEIRRDSSFAAPTAVYPVFEYGRHRFDDLETMLARPLGEDSGWWKPDRDVPDEIPVPGQEHRVVVIRAPKANTGEGRLFLSDLARLQDMYEEAIIHLHGAFSWRVAFGTGLAAADIECRTTAAKGKIVLPNGREVYPDEFDTWDMWIKVLSIRPKDIREPRDRCLFNIRSALWAADNFERDVYFKRTRSKEFVIPDPGVIETHRKVIRLGDTRDGDKVLCDLCSLAPTCKLYRDGGVCAIPGTDVSRLIGMFKSRDAGQIVDGLGVLMATNVERLEAGLEAERDDGELDPKVSRILEALFDQGQKLAKLLNPLLGVKISANLTPSVEGVAAGNYSALVAGVIAELEAQGIPRAQITSEMITKLLERTQQRQAAIEASSTPAA